MSSIEWQEFLDSCYCLGYENGEEEVKYPSWTNVLPSLGSVFLGVRTEEFFATVHGIDAVIYMCALFYE
jgi:hypothetical protein